MHNDPARTSTPTSTRTATRTATRAATRPTAASPRLAQLALGCLQDLDALVDAFVAEVAQIDEYVAGYAAGLIDENDVREYAYPSFELLLRFIAGADVPDRVAAVSRDVGVRRARQGMTLESFMRAIRLDFRVVWAALLEHAHPDDVPDLLHSAFLVWEAVEHHTMQAVDAYGQTALEMAREREDERRIWFSRLLDSDGRLPGVVSQAATVLGLDPSATFVAAVARADCDTGLREPASALREAGFGCHRHQSPGGDVLVVQLPRSDLARPEEWFQRVPCGVSNPVDGLSRLPQAVRLAGAVAATLTATATGPRRLADAWIPVLLSAAPHHAAELAADVLGPLDVLDPGEAARVREAVHAHLSGSGSPAATAQALFCHRNTVLNRLRRFTRATGRDVSRPADAAIVLFALEAEALAGTPTQHTPKEIGGGTSCSQRVPT